MAERRMFAKTIVTSDAFLDMPATAQLLYFHLGMRADDDGFVNRPKAIMRECKCSDGDIRALIENKFLILFDNGVVVVKHWKVNNFVRKDCYTATKYKDEMAALELDENNSYRLTHLLPESELIASVTDSSQHRDDLVTSTATQERIGKVSIGKDIYMEGAEAPPPPKKKAVFKKPTLAEVTEYCTQRKNYIDPQRFVDYYDTNGWMVGRNHMKDWKAAVRNWERNSYSTDKRAPRRDTSELDEVF